MPALLVATAPLVAARPARADASPELQLTPNFPPAPARPKQGGPPASPVGNAEPTGTLPTRNIPLPIIETGVFNVGVWAVDRYALSADYARVSPDTIGANFQGGWSFDQDDFQTNEILHPYMGSVYHTAARSSGWSFWEATALDFGGSLAWKIAGENTPPSINDQITTTIGGAVLGEVLFRVARLLIAGPEGRSFPRRFAAAVLSPATAVNDALLDGRIVRPVPAEQRFLGRLSFGASTLSADARTGPMKSVPGAFFGFQLSHGAPGEMELTEPFDHFDVELDFSSASLEPWEQLHDVRGPTWLLTARGLLVGGQGHLGDDGGILYGLFATLDYGGPQLLRVSATGVGPGLTLAARPVSSVALDATFLAAPTFGSGGAYVTPVEERDYRFGFGALVLAEGRAWFAGRLELAATGRGYLIPAAVGGGAERLFIGKASARFRVVGPHAVGVETTLTRRWAAYPDSAYSERSSLTAFTYSYLFGGP
jgi:hypothetical protein